MNITAGLLRPGVAFNFYDVIVMALDEEVLREQIEKARRHIQLGRYSQPGVIANASLSA